MEISSSELANRTGASYRQVDYWVRAGMIMPVRKSKAAPGSGHRRRFEEEIVDRVTVMVKVSGIFDGHPPGGLLKRIYDNFEDGHIDMGEGIRLTWGRIEK